jgi:hypothetical protein
MSNNISFFTAVKYGPNQPKTRVESMREMVDDYFYLGGRKAHIIGKSENGGYEAVLSGSNSSLPARIGKVLSYGTVFLPLGMLAAKAALRSNLSFRLINPQTELEGNLDINEKTINKINGLIGTILEKQDEDNEVEWLSKENNLVFKLKGDSELVFKMARTGSNDSTERRYKNMIKAKEVCLANDLGQLIIPKAKNIKVGRHDLIVEESLDFNQDESAQEEYYHRFSTDLDKTARQLATFIAKTGFNDVTWRNIPIMNEEMSFQGSRRVALIDLEHMASAANGFTGDFNGSCGLIGCLSERQINIAVKEMDKQGVSVSQSDIDFSIENRKKQLASNENLRDFYNKMGIRNGREKLETNADSLGLSSDVAKEITAFEIENEKAVPVKKNVTMIDVANDVIEFVEKQISGSSDKSSIKGKRTIQLNTSDYPFSSYRLLGDSNQLWLHQILEALVDRNHLFGFQENGYGYLIQA